jgi:hypothetical protein
MFEASIQRHIRYPLAKDARQLSGGERFRTVALTVCDRLVE